MSRCGMAMRVCRHITWHSFASACHFLLSVSAECLRCTHLQHDLVSDTCSISCPKLYTLADRRVAVHRNLRMPETPSCDMYRCWLLTIRRMSLRGVLWWAGRKCFLGGCRPLLSNAEISTRRVGSPLVFRYGVDRHWHWWRTVSHDCRQLYRSFPCVTERQ